MAADGEDKDDAFQGDGRSRAARLGDARGGAGPLAYVGYQGGLRLYFQAGEFAGWEVSEGSGYPAGNGLRVGASAAEVREAAPEAEFTETTLGREFAAGGYYGLLGEDGEAVALLWAGTTCLFR